MLTSCFTDLESSIQTILLNFRDFKREDSSSLENQIKLRACISLIHAEIENYFEAIGLKSLEAFNNKKLNNKVLNRVKYSLTIYNQRSFEGGQEDYITRISNSINSYKSNVNQNNGIKEKDILKIILPIGYPYDEIDSTWITTLNSFGSLRGKLIHSSMSKIKNLIGYDYFDETILKIIIPGIRKIDNFFALKYGIN